MKIEYWNMKGWESVSKLTRVENWLGNNDEDIFRRFTKANQELRYCNGCHYEFEFESDKVKYSQWYDSLTEQVKKDMFYFNKGEAQ